MKWNINITSLILFFVCGAAHANTNVNGCNITNYNAEYIGDPIPLGDTRIDEVIGSINVAFSWRCTFAEDAERLQIFASWGQYSYLAARTFNSNYNGIELVLDNNQILGSFDQNKHFNSIGIIDYIIPPSQPSAWVGGYNADRSGPLFHVKKTGVITNNPKLDSIYLGTNHTPHSLIWSIKTTSGGLSSGPISNFGFAQVPFAYPTCSIVNPDQVVIMPSIDVSLLQRNGFGRYPAAHRFQILLNCEPNADVTMTFNGTAMGSQMDVLSNTVPGNDSLGIQIAFKDETLVLGEPRNITSNASVNNILNFDAYYYNGGSLNPGKVSAQTTVLFEYQ